MKKVIALSGVVFVLISCQTSNNEITMDNNPFYKPYETPFGVPDFENIKTNHFLPAIKSGIEEQKKEIDMIRESSEEPTFRNTIESLERSGTLLDKTTRVFYNFLGMNTSDALQSVAREASPLLTKHRDDILMDKALFDRVNSVYAMKDELGLNTEQSKLLEEHYKAFVRAGANLSMKDKNALKELNERLGLLSLKFGDNLLAEDNEWMLVIDDESDLAGLPDMIRNSAASTAREKGMEGKWVITLHKPSWIPFMQYAENRVLREKVYTAWMNRGNNNNKNDNKEVLIEIVRLRLKKANLLGYNTWADYMLDNNMAGNSQAVYNLLNQLWERAIPMAVNEAAEMQKMIDAEGGDFKLASWDWWFYSEKVRKAKYDLDDEILRPYFEINRVREGLFDVLKKLYGLEFIELTDIPKPHADALAYEVREADGSHIGIYYMDFYPRSSKSGGAWMDAYRKQSRMDGKDVTPVITNVFNFTKPTADKPALITFDEAETMFHEMGHALHGLLSDCTYPSISGTSTPQDFVELPSQIMENWAGAPSVMKEYGRHYETGEVISDELIQKITASSRFNQGFTTVEYLAASLLDMSWHTLAEAEGIDPISFEKVEMDKVGLIYEIIPRYRSTYFGHVFSSDSYSAGYYSYIWAEVLDADAFQAFVDSGDIFNQKIASSFRKNILSRGGTDDAMTLYKSFRGKEPEIDPLLRRRGLD